MTTIEPRISVVITGCGAIAPHTLRPLLSESETDGGLSGFDAPPDPPEITLFDVPDGAPEHAFEIDDFQLNDHIPTRHTFIDRTSAFALAAAASALKEAGLLTESGKVDIETGCCFGTAFGCVDTMKLFTEKITKKDPKFAPPLPFTHSYPNSPSALLAIEFGLTGHSLTFGGGNDAGLVALDAAMHAIQSGMADRILVVAADALTQPVYLHLFANGLLTGTTRRPLPGAGNGVIPGEGAAALVLESENAARLRSCPIVSRLLGTACASGDPLQPFGVALKTAITAGLKTARVTRDEIDVVQLGVPTDDSTDAVELSAVESLGTSPALAAIKLWGGEMMSVAPLAGLIWSIRMIHAGHTTGLYRPGTGTNPKLALSQSVQSTGTAATALVAHPAFM